MTQYAAECGLDESTSAFIAWAAKHDTDVRDQTADNLRFSFEVVDDIRQTLREGLELWSSAGMPEERYRMAKIQFKREVDIGLASVDKTETKSYMGTAWRYLD